MPSCPILLSPEREETYREGATKTNSPTTSALMAGTTLALIGMGASWAIGAFVGLLWAAAAPTATIVLVALTVVFTIASFVAEFQDYSAAHRRFANLETLAKVATQMANGEQDEAYQIAAQRIVDEGLAGSDWVLRHAAVEFEERRVRDLGVNVWPFPQVNYPAAAIGGDAMVLPNLRQVGLDAAA